ncbi:MAG: VOC family protein [Thermomicrobium sp.]|uniref:VOC family protein n=1 Tax=Thermomicrobium sp. TaxID=1969469 RepID=UPI001B099265|nr:VOC family protein [Thermomicrobium sp.]MBO9360385.1 VOC family protein [Thermomicrobium sp.]
MRLRRIHHVCLRVADLDEAAGRWSIQFGLTLSKREPERVLLRCGYEPYSLELIPGQPGVDHVAYELDRDWSLETTVAFLDAHDVAFERTPDAIFLADVEKNRIELVPWAPREQRYPDVALCTTELPAFRPRKLGHVNYLTARLAEQVSFYTNILGMRVTDYLGEEGVWLHINADHHVMALVNKGYAHIHHFAFELVDWGEIRVALDHLAQHGRWIAWGPLRHGLGRNLSAYVRIPEEECFVEIYCDMEQLEADHQPRYWPDNAHSSNVWGILPPRSYFRFDPIAVEWEREGKEALGYPLPPLGGSTIQSTGRTEA